MSEIHLLRQLDAILIPATVRSTIDEIVERLEKKISESAGGDMTWEPVPLSMYGVQLPHNIKSSWVFILRANTPTGPERHPNSIQRVMSYRDSGNLQTKKNIDDVWQSHFLGSDQELPMEQRWLTIPAGVWHQAVAPKNHWAVVSFHTVEAEELIEERPDPANRAATCQRTYVCK